MVRGAFVTSGYYGNEAATQRGARTGYGRPHTGDVDNSR